MAMRREKSEYAIQAVENAFDVLEQFKGAKGSLGITELSANLGLHKNNIFRLLATMENKGYIEQDLNTEEYRLGIKSLEIGRAFLNHTGLLKVAKPILNELMESVNENVYLGLLKNDQVVYVEHVESTQALRVASRVGTRLSPLCTAIGKVILAHYSEHDRERIIANNKFVQHTPNTIMDKGKYVAELAKIREQGYSVDDQEYDFGVVCVGGPVMDYQKKVVAGISISGPSLRMDEKALRDIFVPKIKECSLKLSRAIGYVG
ncbi:hypothetical protein CHS0354_002022 [Potamilus streckersoni]|uniref:IclR family transcriptional regulator n=1 Tax=Potamilus streckersoni TaxID=2493646 RepID=A0AAE0W7R2_9BIVA|nr:hypothetical protein CHS0354_002022 [Potamilus streckersoni]